MGIVKNVVLFIILAYFYSFTSFSQNLTWEKVNSLNDANTIRVFKYGNGLLASKDYKSSYILKTSSDDWNKVEFYFNGKNLYLDKINIGENESIIGWGVEANSSGKNGLYRSSNSGKSWQKISNLPIEKIYGFTEDKNSTIYLLGENTLYKKQLNDSLWIPIKSFPPNNFYWSILKVINNKIFFTVNYEGIYLSEDNGLTWMQSNPNINIISSIEVSINNEIVVNGKKDQYSNETFVAVSNNGGTTWTELDFTKYGEKNVIGTIDDLHTLYIASSKGNIYRSTDFGKNWTSSYQNKMYGLPSYITTINNEPIIFGKRIIKSSDMGRTWKYFSNGFPYLNKPLVATYKDEKMLLHTNQELFLYDIKSDEYTCVPYPPVEAGDGINGLSISNSYEIWATTCRGSIYFSKDLQNWTEVTSTNNFGCLTQIVLSPNNILYANSKFQNYGLYKSTNFGKTWNNIYSRDNFDFFTFINDQNIVLHKGYYNIYTSDGGETWNGNQTNVYLNHTYLINNAIYGFRDSYIFHVSNDNGKTWKPESFEKFGFNISQNVNGILKLSNGLIVYTDKGLFESLDKGNTWNKKTNELSNVSVNKCAVISNSLFAFTSDGIYKANLLTTSLSQTNEKNKIFRLSQNYPNPFNPTTVINYQISDFSHVTLKIFDTLGREVAVLVNESKPAGSYTAQFSIQNSNLPSGVYFYRLQQGSFSQTQKMIISK